MTLGMSIRNRRRDMNLTQKELAAQLYITPGMLCMIERGYREPSWSVIVGLIRLFGIDVIADAVVDG